MTEHPEKWPQTVIGDFHSIDDLFSHFGTIVKDNLDKYLRGKEFVRYDRRAKFHHIFYVACLFVLVPGVRECNSWACVIPDQVPIVLSSLLMSCKRP